MTLASRLAAHLVDHFDEIASEYDTWAGGIHAKAAERLAALLEPGKSDHVLDVGTGTGLVARAVAARLGRGGEVVGIDASPGMLKLARAQTRRRSVRYHEMWAEDLVFRDATFDAVTFGDSLAYLLDPFRALEEAARVTRPGGRIALSCQMRSMSTPAQEISVEELAKLAQEDGVEIPRLPDYHASFGEPEVLTELLRENGFRETRRTQVMTGFRAQTPWEWIEMLAGLGPFTHTVVSSMGPVRRARLAQVLEPQMRELGEDAWRMHLSFTLAVAER